MNVIAAAIFSAAGSILVLAITVIWNGKKDRALSKKEQMLNGMEHEKLSWEHENLEKFLSKDINAVEKAIMSVNKTTNEIKGILLEEKARQSEWCNNLSGEQKDMKAQIDELYKVTAEQQNM